MSDESPPAPSEEARVERDEALRAIEAVIFVSAEPIESGLLAQLLELPAKKVDALCEDLAASYVEEQRGFNLVRVAGGWRFQSTADLAPYVERFVLEGQSARLSAAALETMAIIAYKQPISRAQISAIRGVNVDGVINTLVQRGYVESVGRDTGPGQAVLFGTTTLFLEKMGVDSLAELPPLGDFVPSAEVLEVLEGTLRPSDPRVDLADGDTTDAATAPGAPGSVADLPPLDLDEL